MDRGSQIAYMFRTAFASGSVFSETMLDTLLYQSFARTYLITFARLLLGMDQIKGSGHIANFKIDETFSALHTYGQLFKQLMTTTHEIPIAIYRTDTKPPSQANEYSYLTVRSADQLIKTRREIETIVKTRMDILGIHENYGKLMK